MRSEPAGSPPTPGGADHDPLAGCRILVAISGSIAAVKLPAVVSSLAQRGALIRCVLTPSAARLVSPVALASLSRSPCHLEEDQWSHRAPRPLHVELAEWAELVLVAPLSATSLARWVQGSGDTLLSSTLLATEAPVLAAAAMNTAMWRSPGVRRNWEELQGFERVLTLGPAAGLLACDRQGSGRMAEPQQLLLGLETLRLHGWRRDWLGRRLLVSAGPTREWLDPARCLTNPSSGRMGVMLAQAARLRGAEVDLVHGPLNLDPHLLEGLHAYPAESGAAMGEALARLQPAADAVAMAAAVADHGRAAPQVQKLSKQDLLASLSGGWCEIPDLLAELVARRAGGQRILAFAAHSGDVLPQARAKLRRKGSDLLFANPIDRPLAGFGVGSNEGWLLGPGSRELRIESKGKFAVAHQLISALGALLDPLTPPAEAPSEGLAGRRAAADP